MATLDKRKYFQKIGYTPHSAGQWSFHMSEARFRTAVCGRRYGKSTMAARDAEPQLFVPGSRGWIIGPTYDLGEKEFRVIWNDLIIKGGYGRNRLVKKAYNKKQGDMYIEMPWQSRVEVRSADHPENLVGEALNWVIMSEAAKHKEETWERYVRASLGDYRGWASFATTPEGYNWVHKLWQFGNDPDLPDYQSWTFPSWTNPHVYPGGREDPEIKLVELTTSQEWFLQEYAADFSAFVGKIYKAWDEKLHVRKVEFRPELPNYMAIDWGYTNPLAAIEFQVTPMDEIRVWREHYKSYQILPDHIQEMKNREQPDGYHLDLAFGDAADPEAVQAFSMEYVNCMAMPEAKENWRQGIECVSRFLKTRQTGILDEYGTPLEQPQFVVDHKCYNTIREFNNYKTKKAPVGTNAPEKGQNIDDHAMDAIRYALVHLYELGAQHHLNEVYTPGIQQQDDRGYFTSGVTF